MSVKFTTYRDYNDYLESIAKNPPDRLKAFLQFDGNGQEPDIHGTNCFQGVINHKGRTYRSVIRFNQCGAKGGFPICLKISDSYWHRDDKFNILDLIVNPEKTQAKVLVESRFEDDDDMDFVSLPQGWFDFEIMDLSH